MSKNDNAHSIRMIESLRKVDDSRANDFNDKYPLSKSANIEQ